VAAQGRHNKNVLDGEMMNFKYPYPFPDFIFRAWAYGCALRIGAQYAKQDGYYSPLHAWIESVWGDVIAFVFGWWWWK
jgi:hypothetical protein